MDKQLPGGLGNVQVVLKELVDGEQSFLIQRVDGVLLENLLEEHLAQGSRQLIDQAADTQIFIVDDVLFGVKDLAYLDGDLSLLIALGQIPQMHGDGAHAHHHGAFTVDPEGLLDLGGSLVQFLAARAVRQLADQNHIPPRRR